MYGHQYTKNTFEIKLKYDISSQINCELGYQYQNCNVDEKNINEAEQGNYVNPVYYTNDFTKNSLSFSIEYGFK